jgi:hypothetical protein
LETAAEGGKVVGGPALKGVFGAGMERDPKAGMAGREDFVGLEEEREGVNGGGRAVALGDAEATDDFMLGEVGKGVGEEGVESFVEPGGADDAGSAQEGAEGKGDPLRGVEEKNGVKARFVERLPERKGLFEEKKLVDVGIVLQDLVADGAGEDGDVVAGEGASNILNGGGSPKGVAEGGGGDDQEAVGIAMLGQEKAEESSQGEEEKVLHNEVISCSERGAT